LGSSPGGYDGSIDFARIGVDPGKMGGAPCIRDTRLTVRTVVARVAADGDFTGVLADYPYLEPADVTAALRFAAEVSDWHEIAVPQPA